MSPLLRCFLFLLLCLSDMSILMNVSERSFSQVCSTSLRLDHSTSPSQPTTSTPQQSTPFPSNHTHNPQKQTSNHTTHPHHPNKRAKQRQAKHTQHNVAQNKNTMYSDRSRKDVSSKRRPLLRSIIEKVLFDKCHYVGHDAEAKTFGE